jgi:hypothetical protein
MFRNIFKRKKERRYHHHNLLGHALRNLHTGSLPEKIKKEKKTEVKEMKRAIYIHGSHHISSLTTLRVEEELFLFYDVDGP